MRWGGNGVPSFSLLSLSLSLDVGNRLLRLLLFNDGVVVTADDGADDASFDNLKIKDGVKFQKPNVINTKHFGWYAQICVKDNCILE